MLFWMQAKRRERAILEKVSIRFILEIFHIILFTCRGKINVMALQNRIIRVEFLTSKSQTSYETYCFFNLYTSIR